MRKIADSKGLLIVNGVLTGIGTCTDSIVVIPSSVTAIGDTALKNYANMTSITIPNSVISIGNYAFEGCTGLTSITIPSSVISIGYDALFRCTNLAKINIDNANKNYDSRSNCNAIVETSKNEIIAGCKNTTIPSSVTSIGGYAFDGCTSLTSITIPNNVKNIKYAAFRGCSGLASIIIPTSIESIE